MQATRNLLFGLEERGLNETHLIETTTTGIYGSPEFPIPEGGSVMENGGERDEVPYPAMGGSWYHQCYDAETEVLTRDGWVRFPDLDGDQAVMSMDADSGTTAWNVPSAVQSYEYSGSMVTVSSPAVDLCVTPNHRMLVGETRAEFGGARRIVEARELGRSCPEPSLFTAFPEWEGEPAERLELAGCDHRHNGGAVSRLPARAVPMEPMLVLFGRWLGTGSIETTADETAVRLGAGSGDQLEHLAERLSLEPGMVSSGTSPHGRYVELSDPQLVAYFGQFDGDKRVPARLRNLSAERLRVLLDAFVEGNQTTAESRWSFHSQNEPLVDQLQEIALKAGFGATVHASPAAGSEPRSYRLTVDESWAGQPAASGERFGSAPYDGQVYCCTVDGGIVLVRRGGAPVWSGNSKSHDAANLRLAHGQFGLPVSDVRTAIVYGTETDETRSDDRLKTRFDFDYYFGVVAHRFAAQAVAGYPLTVYGKGEQRKPFVSLEDTVEGLAQLALQDPADRDQPYRVYNQVTRPIAIVEMADTIREVADEFGLEVEVTHVENPRDEDETHQMEIENDRYMELIGSQEQDFEEGMRDILETLTRYQQTIVSHTDRFLPATLADSEE
jgi:hypothetical protein